MNCTLKLALIRQKYYSGGLEVAILNDIVLNKCKNKRSFTYYVISRGEGFPIDYGWLRYQNFNFHPLE